MTGRSNEQEKHAFVSYVHEDKEHVDKMVRALKAAGIPVWVDKTKLGPGVDWRTVIRDAIRSDSMVFLACFSSNLSERETSYQYEELNLAVEEFRRRPPGRVWLIPIRFDDCQIPDMPLTSTMRLDSIQRADLFGDEYVENVIELTGAIKAVMGAPGLNSATVKAAVAEADDSERPEMLRRHTEEMIRDQSKVIALDGIVAQEPARVLDAMRNLERFPTSPTRGGTADDDVIAAVSAAQDYWRLIEPFCWSLQVAARWAEDRQALRPWTTGLQSLVAEAGKPA
ncbi:toll/interleukin-1 receptor domain-containing protein, partial [Mycobacterium sp. 050128]|uniref:toll/interleukin-1 receptor domain-containing protein n=1 Tax=Mycobacterium sp. 050128 TaxID=3096112 RepID=UPI002ED897D8